MEVATQNQSKGNDSLSTPTKRWSAKKKSHVVLRMFSGESIDSLSREIGLPSYILEEWRKQAIQGMEVSLKARDNDPLSEELDNAMKRIGELSMENELLRERCRRQGSFQKGGARK